MAKNRDCVIQMQHIIALFSTAMDGYNSINFLVVDLSDLLGRFVTANLKGKNESRQGWIVETEPFIIQGQSGIFYDCEGDPVVVENPPKHKP